MTTQDSWIDPDELDELVGAFSENKRKGKEPAPPEPKDETPPPKRSKKSKRKTGGKKSRSRPKKTQEKPGKDSVVISTIEDLEDYLPVASPPPLVFESRGEEEKETVDPEIELEPEFDVEPVDEEPRPEPVAEEAEEEPVEELIAASEGSVVFIQDDENEEEEAFHPGTFEIETDSDPIDREEEQMEEESASDNSLLETRSDDAGEEYEELEDEHLLYEGATHDFVTLDPDEDEYEAPNPGLLSDEAEEAREDTTKEDAERAIRALAEAREEVESAELIRLREWAALEEEPLEVDLSENEEVPHADESDDPDLSSDADESSDEEGILLGSDESEKKFGRITIHEEEEAIEEVASEEDELEDVPDPLPEFRLPLAATMVERVACFAEYLKSAIDARSLVIRDSKGFLVYEELGDSAIPVDSFQALKRLRDIEGSIAGEFTQIKLDEKGWLCVVASPVDGGYLFIQSIVSSPVRPGVLRELSSVLSDAILPSRVA